MAWLIPLISAVISAGGAIGGGILGRAKQTPIQRKQKELIDDLMSSLKGQGAYSDLFKTDEASFQKHYVEPMKNLFSNQIAPQIQQSYIYSGQQRGTGMEDTLTRAGVNMEDVLGQQYMNFQQSGQKNILDAIGKILGQGAGKESESVGQGIMGGLAGYTSGAFGGDIDRLLKSFQNQTPNKPAQPETFGDTYTAPRKGFEKSPQYYDYRTGVMG